MKALICLLTIGYSSICFGASQEDIDAMMKPGDTFYGTPAFSEPAGTLNTTPDKIDAILQKAGYSGYWVRVNQDGTMAGCKGVEVSQPKQIDAIYAAMKVGSFVTVSNDTTPTYFVKVTPNWQPDPSGAQAFYTQVKGRFAQ